MKRWLLCVVWCGCVSSNSVICEDGSLCPSGKICTAHDLCVSPDQTTACDGVPDLGACMVGTVAGHCQDGACLSPVCGDGFIEIGEMCDDSNTIAGDGCSADCTSTEICGNKVVDVAFGEQCDDENHLDHDGCSSRCLIETPHWIEHTLAPPARVRLSSAYDPTRDRLIVFGGLVPGSTGGMLGDTWEWNGGEWVRMPTPSAPSGRDGAAMAFDVAHRQAVLFGGTSGLNKLGDTWLWDGTTWTSVAVTDGPAAREGAAMAYDGKRQRIVMFGGQATSTTGSNVSLAETWEWDGVVWTQAMPAHAPPKRLYAATAFDAKRGVVVISGGVDATTTFADTWEYDGTDWTMKSSSAPQASESAMTYDTANQRVLLFGGATLAGPVNTLAAWNGATWTVVTPSGASPTARSAHVMAQTAGRIVMFAGGQNTSVVNNETWSFANNVWTQAKDPGPRDAPGLVNDPQRARLVLFGGVTSKSATTRVGDTWDLAPTGYTARANAPPTARSSMCMTYDYAHHNIVMFGGMVGSGTSTPNGETWIWDGAGWTQRTPAMSPPARAYPACAYDGHRVTLVGGSAVGGSVLGDAWSWDGTTWAPITLPPDLVGRGGASAAYDPIRNNLVLFGGLTFIQSVPVLSDATWLFDGTTWTRVAETAFRPSPREYGAMAWNPARQRITLLGGVGSSAETLDGFEWDGTSWQVIPAVDTPLGRAEPGIASSLDGTGLVVYSGEDNKSGTTVLPDRWELRWDALQPFDRCNAFDADGDHLVQCLDPDCWWVCTPLCPPAPPMTSAMTCDPTVKCGDGICDPSRETCRNCPADCTCAPVCGDAICDPGETGCPGDCP